MASGKQRSTLVLNFTRYFQSAGVVSGRNPNTKKFNGKNILCGMCLLMNLALVGQQTTGLTISQKLDEYLNSANAVYKFNGSALIAEKGRVLLEKGYGLRNVSAHVTN